MRNNSRNYFYSPTILTRSRKKSIDYCKVHTNIFLTNLNINMANLESFETKILKSGAQEIKIVDVIFDLQFHIRYLRFAYLDTKRRLYVLLT